MNDTVAGVMKAIELEEVRLMHEALEEIVRRCEVYEHVNLVGRTRQAKKAGTIRNILFLARAALETKEPS